MDTALLLAFGLSTVAGLCTGIGALIVLVLRRTTRGFLGGSLGFSAGVMIYVSFAEIFPAATELCTAGSGEVMGPWIATGSFFAGILISAAIDRAIPEVDNPHGAALAEDTAELRSRYALGRVGIFTAIAIALHNFPEGIATFVSGLHEPEVGVSIAAAVALHNIPEGISVAVPVFYATRSRGKAVAYSFASGMAEPLGALVAFVALRPFLSGPGMGMVLAAVAGIMVFISLDQLVPNAKKYEEGHQALYGLVGGMALMALTLLWL
jgi:ZIP family zinc transporter